MTASFDQPIAWATAIALAVFAFVLLDGSDLVVGMLFPPFRLSPKRIRADSLAGLSRRRTQSYLRRLAEGQSRRAAGEAPWRALVG
ncbi:MAG TPA: hypothetical protein VGG92_17440 [Caulobacteraceae bacterium]|jgi:hypothetical protein